jgi:hypothetical protein
MGEAWMQETEVASTDEVADIPAEITEEGTQEPTQGMPIPDSSPLSAL